MRVRDGDQEKQALQDFRDPDRSQQRTDHLGGIFVDIKIGDRSTSQMVYVTPELKYMILSHKVCKELGVINEPFLERAAKINKCTVCRDNNNNTCSCPAKGKVPEPLLRPGGSSPVELEKLIKDHYALLAFNKCNKQKLPGMEDSPPVGCLST